MNKKFLLNLPKGSDWAASLVVFIVAIPLTLGISLASGVSVEAGIISAIIGGIIVGILAGAPLMVSGPAAGLSAVVFQIVQDYGFNGLMFITLVCGLFQVFFSVIKSGPVFRLVPHSILNGMLAAIGIIIMFGQLHVLLGQSVPSNFFNGLISLPTSMINALDDINMLIIAVFGIVGILIQVYWNQLIKQPTLKKVPAALITVMVVSLLALSFDMPRVNITSGNLIGTNYLESFNSILSFENKKILSMIFMGFMLCLIASSESLLTARALGDLKGEKNDISNKNLNKELCAQGIGNTLCGIFGGIPITGVIVRSAANINAGAETRWSTILHGIWVLLFVTFFTLIINCIPLTALAAVLVFTGWKLLGLDKIQHAYNTNKEDFFFLVGTIILILLSNLMIGMVISLVTYIVWYALKKNKMQKV